jgi:hypothetical protein
MRDAPDCRNHFEPGAGDAEDIRRLDGGGAERLSRSPECCDVRICPT